MRHTTAAATLPLRFQRGDTVVHLASDTRWRRTDDGRWLTVIEFGAGRTDAEALGALATGSWGAGAGPEAGETTSLLFLPRLPARDSALPGQKLATAAAVRGAILRPAEHALAYESTVLPALLPGTDVPDPEQLTIPTPQVRQSLLQALEAGGEVTFHRPSLRLYARYLQGRRLRTDIFVLARPDGAN